jgi:uncharacterized protein
MKHSSKLIIGGMIVLVGGLMWWLLPVETVTIPLEQPKTTRADYEPLIPMTLGGVAMFASVADSPAERQLGLSRTTSLPPDVVKLFAFPSADLWSFWMKEMLYSIDIIWLDATGVVVHVESNVAPDTYPTSFVPAGKAQYVVETNAGFAQAHSIDVGDTVVLPSIEAVE